MGLKWFAKSTVSPLLIIALFGPSCAANDVVLQNQPWPAAETCSSCVNIQFGKLDMRLPLAETGKVVVSEGDTRLHILPKADDARKAITFLSVPADKFVRRYRDAGLLKGLDVATNEQLLDALGKLPRRNESLAKMRKIEGIDASKRYVKWSKDSVRVYWIESSLPGGSQRAYFVIDGEDSAYMVAGDITPSFLKAALANLKIVPPP